MMVGNQWVILKIKTDWILNVILNKYYLFIYHNQTSSNGWIISVSMQNCMKLYENCMTSGVWGNGDTFYERFVFPTFMFIDCSLHMSKYVFIFFLHNISLILCEHFYFCFFPSPSVGDNTAARVSTLHEFPKLIIIFH